MQNLFRTRLEVDLDVLKQNAVALKEMAGNSDVMAVIKADAYGCGAIMLARELYGQGIHSFAIATLSEAVNLRTHGVPGEILILGYTNHHYADTLIEHEITQALVDLPHATALSEAAILAGGRVKAHIKIDTGMSRVGLDSQNPKVIDELRAILSLPGLEVTGTFTHFASADMFDEQSDRHTRHQIKEFCRVTGAAKEQGLDLGRLHTCNSGGALRFKEAYFDMIRPGSLVVGADPMPSDYNTVMPMKPIHALRTVVGMIKELPEGRPVGYGQSYFTDKPSIIATLPVGYADGYPRALSGKGYVLIHGKRAPVVGRVCMDQIMVDVTDIPGVKPGDTVTLFGSDGGCEITVNEIADLIGTAHPEIMARLGRRLPVYYLRGGKAVAMLDYTTAGPKNI